MNDKKTVHVIEKFFFPVMAGIEVNMHETYKILAKRGWDITFHTSTSTLTEADVLPATETISGMQVLRYKFGLLGYFPKIDWDKADFVCLHNFNVVPHFIIMAYAFWLKMLGKKKFKLFLTPHGGFNPEWSIFKPLTRLVKSTYHFTLGTFMINLIVDGVRAVSEWEKEQMISKGVDKNKIAVIDNGLEDEAFEDVDAKVSDDVKDKVKSWGRYLVQVGRVYVIKNNETVIKALPLLPSDINFVLVGPVGDEDYKKSLIELAKSLGVENRVIFAGVVTGFPKYYMIKHSLMMVHMALWESFCNVVHEGLSQAKVCIVANNTALPYLIKDNERGYLVETKDYSALAAKINYVLSPDNKTEVARIEDNAKQFGLRNSWTEVAGRMADFYLSK